MEPILTAKDVVKVYHNLSGEPFYAVSHVSMEIERKSLTILRGRSGSGKTTMLNMMSALDLPDSGTITCEEIQINVPDEKIREQFRRTTIGYIFQAVALIPIMNAYENVEFSLRLSGYQGDYRERVEECLTKVGLKDRMYHMPYEMSGGEQQRVAIARAIAHKPKLIFADEPTAELDTQTALQVIKVFKDLIEKEDVSIIMTTHDAGLFDVGDVCYEMEDGQIVGKYVTGRNNESK